MIVVFDNVVDPTYGCLTDEIVDRFDRTTVVNLPRGESVPPLDDVEAVVITGSSAGVYEAADRPWIAEERSLVADLVERDVPTLGICFGHQLVNAALGGAVEARSLTAGLVRADFDADPLFDGVEPVVPVLHGDHVVELGESMTRIGTAPHCRHFAARHESAPVWTVQYHPELTAGVVRERVEPRFGWESNGWRYDDATAMETLANFRRLVERR